MRPVTRTGLSTVCLETADVGGINLGSGSDTIVRGTLIGVLDRCAKQIIPKRRHDVVKPKRNVRIVFLFKKSSNGKKEVQS